MYRVYTERFWALAAFFLGRFDVRGGLVRIPSSLRAASRRASKFEANCPWFPRGIVDINLYTAWVRCANSYIFCPLAVVTILTLVLSFISLFRVTNPPFSILVSSMEVECGVRPIHCDILLGVALAPILSRANKTEYSIREVPISRSSLACTLDKKWFACDSRIHSLNSGLSVENCFIVSVLHLLHRRRWYILSLTISPNRPSRLLYDEMDQVRWLSLKNLHSLIYSITTSATSDWTRLLKKSSSTPCTPQSWGNFVAGGHPQTPGREFTAPLFRQSMNSLS